MKKLLSFLLVPTLAFTTLAACSSNDSAEGEKPANDTADVSNTADAAEESGITKLGLGLVTSIAKSADADGETTALGQVDTVIASVAFDNDGRVVDVTIDNAQTKVEFDESLKLVSDVEAELKTKVELGDEYGMIKGSAIGKEWYEQIAALEDWMTGKTVEEIKGMKTVEKDAGHPAVPDEADLTSSVTISVESYIAAVAKAYENAIEVESGAVKLGLGHNISIAKSKGLDAANDQLPLAQVDTVVTASLFDVDGKVVGTIIDNAQTKVEFDENGVVTTDRNGTFKSKVELGDEYGMIKGSSIGKEWYEQIAALEDWMTGKTVEEIKGMETVENVPSGADLTSSVTISVESYIAAIAEAYTNAQ